MNDLLDSKDKRKKYTIAAVSIVLLLSVAGLMLHHYGLILH
jgi:hypothetical protein